MKAVKVILPLLCIGALFILGTALGVLAGKAIPVMQSADGRRTIILDAGHGGEDGGTAAGTGKLESSYNLEITLRLRDALHLLGYRTKLIRSTDVSVYTAGDTIAKKKISDLKNRVSMVNAAHNAILISIHQNFYGDSRYSGAQVFYGGGEESRMLAQHLQEALRLGLCPENRRKIKQGEGIYLLDKTHCPRVLVECGFLSNPREARLLASKAYQQKLAAVMASSLAEYLTKSEKPDNIV